MHGMTHASILTVIKVYLRNLLTEESIDGCDA